MVCSEFLDIDKSSLKDYDKLDEIGKGGFATVYKAKYRKTGAYVAIKEIDKNRIKGKIRDRVREEIKIQLHLQHDSFLRCFTFFEDDYYVYIVLELCPNGDLGQQLEKNGRPFTENETREYLCQVVHGLLYLHSLRIMHRDLTLRNLLVDLEGQIKIADFGMATQLKNPDDKHRTMVGTPNYMSPEIVTRNSYGLETDVWSLGCMMYTMLAGFAPFEMDTKQETLNRIADGRFDFPSGISTAAKDLIKRCLMKYPEQRIKLEDVPNHAFFLPPAQSNVCRTDSGVYTSGASLQSKGTHYRGNSVPPILEVSEKSHQPHISNARAYNAEMYGNSPPVRLGPGSVESVQHGNQMFGQLKNKFGGLPQKLIPNYEDCDYNSPVSNKHFFEKPADCQNFAENQRNMAHSEENLDNFYKNLGEFARPFHSDGCHYRQPNSDPVICDRSVETCDWGAGSGPSRFHQNRAPCRSVSLERKNIYPRKPKLRSNSLDRYNENREHRDGNYPTNYIKACTCNNTSNHRSWCGSKSVYQSDGYFSQNALKCGKILENIPTVNRLPFPRKHLTDENKFPVTYGIPKPTKNSSKSSGCSSNKEASTKIPVNSVTQGIQKPSNRSANSSNSSNSNIKEKILANNAQNHNIRLENVPSNNKVGQNSSEPPISSGSLKTPESPIKSRRLKPVRVETKNAICHILYNGDVCVEFLISNLSTKKVVNVLKISPDGLNVLLYQPNRNIGIPISNTCPEIPDNSKYVQKFTYQNLPEKHFKKYKNAKRFVSMVRAKTPKVTYYSDQAKCILMENFPYPDFEAVYYNSGEKCSIQENKIEIIDKNKVTFSYDLSNTQNIDYKIKNLYIHSLEIKEHCLNLERILTSLEETSTRPNFPLVIGKRPSSSDQNLPSPNAGLSTMTTNSQIRKHLENKENEIFSMVSNRSNFSPQDLNSVQAYKNVQSNNRKPFGAHQGGNISNNLSKKPVSENSVSTIKYSNKHSKSISEKFIDKIGWFQNKGEEMCLQYLDGTKIEVDTRFPKMLLFTDSNNKETKYEAGSMVPKNVDAKLKQFITVKNAMFSANKH